MLAPIMTIYSRVEDREVWKRPQRHRPRKSKKKDEEPAQPVPDLDGDGDRLDITA
jgi:hypothetical protein